MLGDGIEQRVIGVAVAIEIRCGSEPPAGGKRWAVRRADINIVVQIPDRRLPRVGAIEHVVRVAVVVKIAYHSPCCYWRNPNVINIFFTIKCRRVRNVRTPVVRNDRDVVAQFVLVRITEEWVK